MRAIDKLRIGLRLSINQYSEWEILITIFSFITGVIAWFFLSGNTLVVIQPFIISISSLIILFFLYQNWKKLGKPLNIPLMFTEENDRDKSQNLFDRFITETNLYDESNKICKMASFRTYPFIFHGVNPRTSDKEEDWIREWKKIIEEWDKRDGKIDEILSVFGGSRIYHIFPHIPLSLAFMLGASVNLRRSIVLYHKQEKHENKNFYKVIDLIDPRVVSHKPIDQSIPEPEVIYDKNTNIEKPKDKLILHIGITKRHDFPEFSKHSDYKKANSICLLYKQDIDPEKDWLPYVQRLIEKIIPLIGKYNEIDICISTPSVIAFALGMALSRTPKIKICKFNSSSQYAPILSLKEIENLPRLPFS